MSYEPPIGVASVSKGLSAEKSLCERPVRLEGPGLCLCFLLACPLFRFSCQVAGESPVGFPAEVSAVQEHHSNTVSGVL